MHITTSNNMMKLGKVVENKHRQSKSFGYKNNETRAKD